YRHHLDLHSFPTRRSSDLMIRAKRCAHRGDDDALRLAIVPDEGHDLFAQIRVEHGLHVAAVERMPAFVVKAEPIDGIHRIEFDYAAVDEVAERAHHALAFEFPFIAGAGRKTKQGRAPVAVDHDAKLP